MYEINKNEFSRHFYGSLISRIDCGDIFGKNYFFIKI